jgi:hypothetical protein
MPRCRGALTVTTAPLEIPSIEPQQYLSRFVSWASFTPSNRKTFLFLYLAIFEAMDGNFFFLGLDPGQLLCFGPPVPFPFWVDH